MVDSKCKLCGKKITIGSFDPDDPYGPIWDDLSEAEQAAIKDNERRMEEWKRAAADDEVFIDLEEFLPPKYSKERIVRDFLLENVLNRLRAANLMLCPHCYCQKQADEHGEGYWDDSRH